MMALEHAGEHQRIEHDEAELPQPIEHAAGAVGGSSPASTLPPSSGGIGIRLKNASSRLMRTHR